MLPRSLLGTPSSGPDGNVAIDQLATLGQAPFWNAPINDRLQHSEEDVRAAAQRLCRKLGRNSDVRADARCGAARTGAWKQRITPDEALCTRAPARPAPAKPRPPTSSSESK